MSTDRDEPFEPIDPETLDWIVRMKNYDQLMREERDNDDWFFYIIVLCFGIWAILLMGLWGFIRLIWGN